MRRIFLASILAAAAVVALVMPAEAADVRRLKADSITVDTLTCSESQLTTTVNPASTAVTAASMLVNPTACGANEILIGAAVADSAKATVDCEGDVVGVKGTFSGVLTSSSQVTSTLNPADTTNTSASLLVNPAACASNEPLAGVLVNGTTEFLVDCEGDTTTTGAATFNGNVTLGNATSDTVTVTAALSDLTFQTGLSGGADITSLAAAADTAGQTTDVLGQAGGAASTDQVGKNGGAVTVTAGAGSAKDGAGATDGDGGDVVLLGGARGGATGGTEVHGIVRVGSPTVGSTKATNLLAVAGGFEVDGAAKFDGDVKIGTTCTGNVTTNAVTCSGNSGVITDDGTDINIDTTRADITWTNTSIASTSVVLVNPCSARQTNTSINAVAVPGAGSATLSVRNDGTANFTAAGLKLCFVVLN